VSRDEQAAGQIDAMLAKLEFTCDEARRLELLGGEGSVAPGECACVYMRDNAMAVLVLSSMYPILSTIPYNSYTHILTLILYTIKHLHPYTLTHTHTHYR